MSDSFGIRVRYLDFEKDGESATYNELSKLIEGATTSISIVNSYLPETHTKEEDTSDAEEQSVRRRAAEARKRYYDKLLAKARDNNIEYIRVQQSKEDNLR